MCGTAKMVVTNTGKMICVGGGGGGSTPSPPTPSPTSLGLNVRYVRITRGADQDLLGLCWMSAYEGRRSHTHLCKRKWVCGSKSALQSRELLMVTFTPRLIGLKSIETTNW